MRKGAWVESGVLSLILSCIAVLFTGLVTLAVKENTAAVNERTRMLVEADVLQADLMRRQIDVLKRIANSLENLCPPAPSKPKTSSLR